MLTITRKRGWRIFLSSFSLIIGFSAEGYLLSAFQASGIIWFSTLILIVYVAIAGRGATALAYAWILGVFMVCTLAFPWSEVWPADIPWKGPELWASIFLALLLFTAWLIWLLSNSSDKLNEYAWGWKVRLASLGGLCWVSMGLGRLLYQGASAAIASSVRTL